MKKKSDFDPKVIERGDIYFFYRPRVHAKAEKESIPHSSRMIQRFYIILHSHEDNKYRLMILGKKHLPDSHHHEKAWLTVEKVSIRPKALLNALKETTYATKTRGDRVLPAARPCGEGVYCILKDERQTYLSYHLQYPYQMSEVQKALNLASDANYVFSVKNQEIAGTQSGKPAKFPKSLIEKFRNLRFSPIDPPHFMNYAGAELLLIAVNGHKPEKTKAVKKKLKGKDDHNKIFNDLKLWKNEKTVEPLFEGRWA